MAKRNLDGRRVLAVRSGALGDTLCVLPALACLRRAVGENGHLDFLGRGEVVELMRGRHFAHESHSIDRAPFSELAQGRWPEALAGTLWDAAIVWSRSGEFERVLCDRAKRLVLRPPLPGPDTHAVDHALRTVGELGVPTSRVCPALAATSAARLQINEWLRHRDLRLRRLLVIHPGSGSADKNWPVDGFVRLAKHAELQGYDVLWLQGEADAAVVQAMRERTHGNVAEAMALTSLVALLSGCAGYLGNDSGVSHLAGAVRAPSVVLFGPTNPDIWAPLAADAVAFETPWTGIWDRLNKKMVARVSNSPPECWIPPAK